VETICFSTDRKGVFFIYYYFKKAIKLMNFEAFIYFFILLSIFLSSN
jgi:hypothetical protein